MESESIHAEKYKKIKFLIKSMETGSSIKSIGSFVKLFRNIINEEGTIVESGKIFNEIMLFSILKFPIILKEMLKLNDETNLDEYKIKNKKVEIILKVYLTNLYKFIDKTTDEKIMIFVLKNLGGLPLLLQIMQGAFRSRFIKLLINLWATHTSILVKLNSFAILRIFAKLNPKKNVEGLLKKLKIAYENNAKTVNWRNYELLTFMSNCFAEFVSIDFETSYFVAFGFISQKASILKNLMKDKNKNNIHTAYCWRFWNSTKLWINAVTAHLEQMEELLLPLIQLCNTLLELYKNKKFYPFFLHILKELNQISTKTGIYIPIVKNIICELLSSSEFQHKKKNEKSKPFDFDVHLKVSKDEIKSNNYWNVLLNELLNLLLENLALSQKKLFFPEMLTSVYYWLKTLQKKFVFNFYKMKIKIVLQLLRENVDLIGAGRREEGLKPDLVERCKKFKLKVKKKSGLTVEINRIREEQEKLRRQKILAEKEEEENEENEEEEEEGEEEEPVEEEGEEGEEEEEEGEELDMDAPLSDEENLDLE